MATATLPTVSLPTKPVSVNREELLQSLESVRPGLSIREVIQQSSCFVFKDGDVMTFNDEVTCRHKCKLNITGAVQAEPLLNILSKMVETEVEISIDKDSRLVVMGKKRRARIKMEMEIVLPIGTVEKPEKWQPIHEDFSDAIFMVKQCAGKDQTQLKSTCIHIHPNFVEACDNFQLMRYKLKTGVVKPFCVRATSIAPITSLAITQFSETPNWIHFKNAAGLVLSCRRDFDEYVDLDKLYKITGVKTTLPKGLIDATERAEIFSSENADANYVSVLLCNGNLRISGEGISGDYQENRKLKYSGKDMSFTIEPKLLIELAKRYNDCEMADTHLKVDGGKWVYLTCLSLSYDKKE